MSQINRPPLGLQQLLGSQNFGDNPNDLAQTVAPTIDLLPFFGSGILRIRRSSGILATEGEITSIEFDEPIALLSVAGWNEAGVSVGTLGKLGLAISGPPSDSLPVNQQHMLAADQFSANYPTSTQPAVCYSFPTPLVVEPGSAVHLHWLANTGSSNTSVQLTVMYYDLSLG